MKRKRIVILFVALVLGVLALSTLLGPMRKTSLVSAAEDKPRGKLTKVFRKDKSNKNDPLPDWVDQALKKGKGHLKQGGREWSKQLIDVESELDVQTAEEDDLGETRVRVGQVFNGVPVIGGQLIIHEDANGVRDTDGRGFSAARHVDTKPTLKPKDALDAAGAARGYNGKSAREPQANLVILPNEVIDRKNRIGANLVYVVELLVEDDPNFLGRHFYYINANDGHVVWNYNGLATLNGNSLYSGQVTVPSRQVSGQYWLQDGSRGIPYAGAPGDPNTSDQAILQGGNWTTDLAQHCDKLNPGDQLCSIDRTATSINLGTIFTNTIDSWGDSQPYLITYFGQPTTSNQPNEQTAGIDAAFASAQVWDYFHNTYGRDGIDGQNFRMLTRVHWALKNDFAFWNGRNTGFGDSNPFPNLGPTPSPSPTPTSAMPWTTLDIVSHEITHCMFEKALGIDVDGQHPFIYTLETAALNESLADIFGTATEFYARERQCIPCPANQGTYRTCEQRGGVSCLLGNYYLGEDQKNGAGYFRDMANPAISSYSNINYATNTAHQMGSIQSKVFWLLAQTGTNTWNGVSVTGIGRADAEKVFFLALTQRLSYADSSFASVRKATLKAACNAPSVRAVKHVVQQHKHGTRLAFRLTRSTEAVSL